MLGLVSIIVLFVPAPGTAPRNQLCSGPSPSVSDEQPVTTGPGNAAGVHRTKGMRRGSPTQRQGLNHLPQLPPHRRGRRHPARLTQTVSRWAKEGKLPFLRTLGGHRRYPEAEIRDLAEGLREEATA
jgi:excisionase family DNA binding protein